MKKYLWIPLLGFGLSATAQTGTKTYLLDEAPRYSEETGYGYDLVAPPAKDSKSPFFFSVRVPDGNYKVTVRLGSRKQAGITTVRAESRRLFIESVPTKKKEFIERTFIVNKRNTHIDGNEYVRIKPREKRKLNWDDKLTLEFNGSVPVCESITIEPADTTVTTVFLCGNSTVVDQDNEPWASWGQMIPYFFDTNVCIANYAESGESANTFIAAGRLKKALSQMKKGDYLFMEFGHNDQKQKGPGKGAYYSFMTSLKTHIRDTHEDYPEAMRWLAEKENVPLIDLNEMTRTLYEAMGVEPSKRAFVHYPAGSYPGQTQDFADNTHFNPYGAYEIARCIVEGLKTQVSDLARHLKPFPAFDPARPDNPDNFHWDDSPFTEIEKPDGN